MDADTPRSGIDWPIGRTRHTVSPHGRRLRWRRLVVAATGIAVPLWLLTVAAPNAHTVTTAFAFTGTSQPYVVPANVCRIRIEAIGAAGGEGGTAGTPGAGAWATASFVVTPRETLFVHVGGVGGAAAGPMPGDGGWNGGGAGGRASDETEGRRGKAGAGGGGATDVRRGGDGLDHRIVVAGGGSGGAGGAIGGPIGTSSGDGGDLVGQDGFAALGSVNPATGGREGARPWAAAPAQTAPGSRSPQPLALSESEATAPRAGSAAEAEEAEAFTAAAAAGPPGARSAAATVAAALDPARQEQPFEAASRAAMEMDERTSATTATPTPATRHNRDPDGRPARSRVAETDGGERTLRAAAAGASTAATG